MTIKNILFFIRNMMIPFIIIFFVSSPTFAKESKETVTINQSEITPSMNSLEEVRTHINGLDEMILILLQNRQELVFHAAKFKTDENEVRDEKRVQEVLDRIEEKAKAIGLDETLARNVYKTLIDRFIEIELERHAKLVQEQSKNPE